MTRNIWVILLLGLSMLGCKPPAPLPTEETGPRVAVTADRVETGSRPKVQVSLGGTEPEDWGRLAFSIVKLHSDRRPSPNPPYHEAGGKWTFLDCQLEGEPSAIFSVGLMGSGKPGVPLTWCKVVLAVANREDGAIFIDRFARAFHAQVPPTRSGGRPLEPLRINTAVLGEGINREPTGGFGGRGGNWTATKWFPTIDGFEAEVFFNFNLVEKVGEFSEKDVDYRKDLLDILASGLRDGARPERTPETDPNLTRDGPRIEPLGRLAGKGSSHVQFSRDSRHLIYSENTKPADGTTVFVIPLDRPDRKPFEIARFEHNLWSIHLINDDLDLLVKEGIPEHPPSRSSADPMRLWWVSQKGKEKTLLRGPEKDVWFGTSPVSPDGRYVAFRIWRSKPEQKGQYSVIEFLDRKSSMTRTADKPGTSLGVVTWEGIGANLRAVAEGDRWTRMGKKTTQRYLIDPATGTIVEATGEPPLDPEKNPVSPDGRYQASIKEGELIVTDKAGGPERRFRFHEDDRRFVGEQCVKWVSPRYLLFQSLRLALIDVTSMKMSYPVAVDPTRKTYGHEFSPDFRWATYYVDHENETELHLGRVSEPERK